MLEGRALTRVEAIVLDLDDTVFDGGEWNVAALSQGAARRGMQAGSVERAIAEFLRTRSPHDPALYNAILLGCFQSDNGFNVRALHEAASEYRGEERSWEPYPGVLEALSELRRHFRLALLAEGPPEQQKAKLKALGISSFFELIVFSDEIDGVRSRRPDPRPFQLLREKLDLQGRQILFVGDQPARDFKEARRQSFVTCRVFTGASRAEAYPDATHRADYEITSLARLPELLASSQRSISSYLLSHLPFLDVVGRPDSAIASAAQEAVASQLSLELPMAALEMSLLPPAPAQAPAELSVMPQPPLSADPAPEQTPAAVPAQAADRRALELLPTPALPLPRRSSMSGRRDSASRRLILHTLSRELQGQPALE
ncbi:HAD family hydrolase [bacterium]|nr:HAD family hydrolase [bacterium]